MVQKLLEKDAYNRVPEVKGGGTKQRREQKRLKPRKKIHANRINLARGGVGWEERVKEQRSKKSKKVKEKKKSQARDLTENKGRTSSTNVEKGSDQRSWS